MKGFSLTRTQAEALVRGTEEPYVMVFDANRNAWRLRRANLLIRRPTMDSLERLGAVVAVETVNRRWTDLGRALAEIVKLRRERKRRRTS